MAVTGEVFKALMRREVNRFIDTEGRPLGERAAEDLYFEVPHPERTAPFKDSRGASGKPINLAGLRQVMRHWRTLIDVTEALVARDVEEGPTSVHQAWRVISTANTLPTWMKLRAQAPVEHIPEVASALYKATLGYSRVFPALLLDDELAADSPLVDLYPPEAFFELLDAEGWLVGSHQACAGSKAAICQFYSALLSPSSGEARLWPEFTDPGFVRFEALWRELFALTVAFCAAAGLLVGAGKLHEAPNYGDKVPDKTHWPFCLRLFESDAPFLDLVRSQPFMGPDRASWLYPDGEAPESLLGFYEALDAMAPEPLAALDDAFLQAAGALMADVMASLGFEDAPRLEHADLRQFMVRLVGEERPSPARPAGP